MTKVARREHGGTRGTQATSVGGTNSVPRGDYVPNLVDSTADQFAAVILPFKRKVIANIARVSPETVKQWRKGRQLPQTEHLFLLAQSIPAVQNWALAKLGVSQPPEFQSPQFVTAMYAAMYQAAHQSGPDGDAVRAALSKLNAAPSSPPDFRWIE